MNFYTEMFLAVKSQIPYLISVSGPINFLNIMKWHTEVITMQMVSFDGKSYSESVHMTCKFNFSSNIQTITESNLIFQIIFVFDFENYNTQVEHNLARN